MLELTEDKVIALRNILHIACMARGMEVAPFAVAFDHELVTAFKAMQDQKPKPKLQEVASGNAKI